MTVLTVHLDLVDRGAVDVEVTEYGVAVTSRYKTPLTDKLDPGSLPTMAPAEARLLAAIILAQAEDAER